MCFKVQRDLHKHKLQIGTLNLHFFRGKKNEKALKGILFINKKILSKMGFEPMLEKITVSPDQRLNPSAKPTQRIISSIN